MNESVFERNLAALSRRDDRAARLVLASAPDGSYAGCRLSKTGITVPATDTGIAWHSLYDPVKEGAGLASSIPEGTFVFFAGIAGAFHIREYLRLNPDGRCIAAEAGYPAFRSLLETSDISGLLDDPRVTVVPDCTETGVAGIFSETYLPALDGDFRLVPLRSWQNRFPDRLSVLEKLTMEALAGISADYSVQAHFGRLWLRNCIENLSIAGGCPSRPPRLDANRTALIAAAGPGLEDSFAALRADRERYAVFATDTAYSSLADSGIIPDVLVSIDAQSVSSGHVMHSLPASLTVVMDVCGNPAIAYRAAECGCNLVFAAGGHPLARHAARFSPLPPLETGAGTVTVSAIDAAGSLGFADIRLAGADFRYTRGKPYCRGTYLAAAFGKNSTRFSTGESLYTALMFRSPVTRVEEGSGLTYSTGTLDRYARACEAFSPHNRWKPEQFAPFPSRSFLATYRNSLEELATDPDRLTDRNDPVLCTLLPFLAWNGARQARTDKRKEIAGAINLALGLIAGYTGVS